ncbi:pilus assembly protein TadG-related protein [Azohydromonas aeria]|uniref:pilus assembly protein TadG-related protein n=1 Tax=Azohydromonas aeria TaxID=2590212 RepID=UPI0012F7EF6A|nr:pilus assembly protein TadG-related protein [Azohydromonas aeria]
MQAHRNFRSRRRARQQGAVAVMFALALVVLMGFAGLALDGARLYVNRAELQNAADACALAVAQELPSSGNTTLALRQRARDAGLRVATRNRIDFQQQALTDADVTVEFSRSATGNPWLAADAAPADARFARCKVAPSAVTLWFMPVLGQGSAQVNALAGATRDISGNNCAARPPDNCTTVASLVR